MPDIDGKIFVNAEMRKYNGYVIVLSEWLSNRVYTMAMVFKDIPCSKTKNENNEPIAHLAEDIVIEDVTEELINTDGLSEFIAKLETTNPEDFRDVGGNEKLKEEWNIKKKECGVKDIYDTVCQAVIKKIN